MAIDVATTNKQKSLINMSCAPCKSKGGNPSKLSTAEFERYLKYELCPSWVAAPDLSSIARTFVARNFQAALDWVVAAGALAEKQGHHPDLHITKYRQVILPACNTNIHSHIYDYIHRCIHEHGRRAKMCSHHLQ